MTMLEVPTFTYERWRHGGWYVDQVHYPSGAVGCISRNWSEDKKWRIVTEVDCVGFDKARTFANRDECAAAELEVVRRLAQLWCAHSQDEPFHGAKLGWRCELAAGHSGLHRPDSKSSHALMRYVFTELRLEKDLRSR
jgi:hypothetical protein